MTISTVDKKLRVTIAGASGFVGSSLLKNLPKDWQTQALSRGKDRSTGGLIWREADLFSLQSSVAALADTDVAIYLVHSMLPSTRLFQGNFADADLLIADNFARACVKNGVKQIIYLGGLVPAQNISKHLASRREIEEVFRATGIPCTTLRAGMVAGSGGSSFEILRNLVTNLPAMILPQWTQAGTQVIYIDDLVRVILESVMNRDFFDKTIDVVNGEKLNYETLIRTTCRGLAKRRFLVRVPIRSTAFSKLWVSFFGNASYELVAPLIDSLLCELPQNPPLELIAGHIQYRTFERMLETILKTPTREHSRITARQPHENSVRSIQRLPALPSMNCDEIAECYEKWLSRASLGLIKVDSNIAEGAVRFRMRGMPWPLLVLKRVPNHHAEVQRTKFHIVGGLLAKRSDCGWLEFRQVANKKFTLASINEFVPTLPWYVYRFTQALLHRKVMTAFARGLAKGE